MSLLNNLISEMEYKELSKIITCVKSGNTKAAKEIISKHKKYREEDLDSIIEEIVLTAKQYELSNDEITSLEDIFTSSVVARGNFNGMQQLNNIAIFGEKVRKHCEKFERTPFDVIAAIQIIQQRYIETSIKTGASFHPKHWKIPTELREQNKKNYEKMKAENEPVAKSTPSKKDKKQNNRESFSVCTDDNIKPSTMSIGDMIKAQQKHMEKKNG